MHSRLLAILFVVGTSVAAAAPVLAQDATHMTACTTKAECDLWADQRETAARQAEWNANVKREADYAAQRQQLRAQAQTTSENGKLSRIDEIMRRRRAAAAAAGN